MPSSTSTLTTSKARPENTAPRLRALDQEAQSKLSAAKEGNDYDIFFWTYTEEPHRTRRQAIITAHPEVGHLIPLALAVADTNFAGYQALRAGTIDQVLRYSCCPTPSIVCVPLTKHAVSLMAVLFDCLHSWGYCEPKPLPRYS
jgi:hypothetical protein